MTIHLFCKEDLHSQPRVNFTFVFDQIVNWPVMVWSDFYPCFIISSQKSNQSMSSTFEFTEVPVQPLDILDIGDGSRSLVSTGHKDVENRKVSFCLCILKLHMRDLKFYNGYVSFLLKSGDGTCLWRIHSRSGQSKFYNEKIRRTNKKIWLYYINWNFV